MFLVIDDLSLKYLQFDRWIPELDKRCHAQYVAFRASNKAGGGVMDLHIGLCSISRLIFSMFISLFLFN